MEFGILGPVEVRIDGQVADAGHSKRRAVLAVLLLDLGRAVPAELLIDRVWGEQPPASVRNALRGYLARLRKVIAAAEPQVQLTRSPGGYLLRAPAERLDLHRFRRLAADAAAAADNQSAAARLREALGLWRGQALTGLDSPWLRAMRQTLEGERAAAVLDLNEVRLRLGEHAALVSELSGQAAVCPGDERLIGQLMLALYRCGRQADALGWFEQTRAQLADELGADPGPGLRSLHQQILRAHPALTTLAGSGPARIAAAPVPRQLPPDVSAFTGRAVELSQLDQLIEAGQATTTVISAIGGTAGVGKTALALHWAHQAAVAGRFPDGQLYADLRGFAPSGAPAHPAEAVRGFLDALGVPPERIPQASDAQAGLYRTLLADRRMLIVLDNARDEDQVRPLLPASPASLVIITSRNQLAGLVAAGNAQLVSLDVLTHVEAGQLLSARIGGGRADAEPEAAAEIAALCVHLPLALAVAAARAAARPDFPLATLAGELRDASGRLEALDAGDPVASVRAVFSWSYSQLSNEVAQLFRLLGLHPGPDVSVPAAASLMAAGEPAARRLLRELARDCLITEHAPGRYAFHDLLRAYAAAKAREHDSAADCESAVGRILDHYLHTAVPGSIALDPSRGPVTLAPPSPAAVPERFADHRQALAWFETEHRVLRAAVALADSADETHAWQLPWAMVPFLRYRGHYQERAATLRGALAAATRLGDTAGQAVCSRLLAAACADLRDDEQALALYTTSLDRYQQLRDRLGEARVHLSLAALAERHGRYARALGHNQQALRLYQATSDKMAQAHALNGVGWCHALLGDYAQARVLCTQALALSGELGFRLNEGHTLDSLGFAEHHLGNHAEAAACYERALAILREFGVRSSEATILIHLGDTRHAAGDLPRARDAWRQALAILQDLDHPGAGQVRAKLAGIVE